MAEPTQAATTAGTATLAPMLRVTGLSAGYFGNPVVRELDLHVGRGEVVALLGANGAGKTTTVMTVAGLLEPIAGDVEVDGVSTVGTPAHVLARRGISLVPATRALFFGLTTREHLKLAKAKDGVSESDLLQLLAQPGPSVPAPQHWPIKQFMTGAPVTITLDTSLAEARLAFEQHHIHHLPVLSEGRAIGIVHERDIRVAEAIFGASQNTRAVHVAQLLGDIHSDHARPDEALAVVLERMIRDRVDAVLVVENDVLCGIFTLVDACRVLTVR